MAKVPYLLFPPNFANWSNLAKSSKALESKTAMKQNAAH